MKSGRADRKHCIELIHISKHHSLTTASFFRGGDGRDSSADEPTVNSLLCACGISRWEVNEILGIYGWLISYLPHGREDTKIHLIKMKKKEKRGKEIKEERKADSKNRKECIFQSLLNTFL